MVEIVSGIYAIENKINGKKYIGASKNILRRWLEHKSELNLGIHHNDYFQKSWRKYGQDGFYFYIIDRCSEDELEEFEKYYIKKLKTRDDKFGYNLSDGGSINKNIIISDEVRAKISESKLGKFHTQEHKDKVSSSNIKSKLKNKNIFLENGNHIGICRNRCKKGFESWIAKITFNGIQYHLGVFESKENAIIAYDTALLYLSENFDHIYNNESEG